MLTWSKLGHYLIDNLSFYTVDDPVADAGDKVTIRVNVNLFLQ